MIIAIDALPIICTLLVLNRELTNLIQNPASALVDALIPAKRVGADCLGCCGL